MSLVLLDGASMWFRSYFGVPSSIKAPDGRQVNAVRGFLDAVATVITRERPGRLVVCRDDDWRPQWRVDLIPSDERIQRHDPVRDRVEMLEQVGLRVGDLTGDTGEIDALVNVLSSAK